MKIKPILKIGDISLTPNEQQIADTAAGHLEITRQSIWEVSAHLVMGGRPSFEAWYLASQLDNLCDYTEAWQHGFNTERTTRYRNPDHSGLGTTGVLGITQTDAPRHV